MRMRDILIGDDISAARDVMRELVGTLPVEPGEGYVTVQMAAQNVTLMTGTGTRIWCGSGGMIRNYNHRNFHEIFFDHRFKPFRSRARVTGYSF